MTHVLVGLRRGSGISEVRIVELDDFLEGGWSSGLLVFEDRNLRSQIRQPSNGPANSPFNSPTSAAIRITPEHLQEIAPDLIGILWHLLHIAGFFASTGKPGCRRDFVSKTMTRIV